MISSIERRGLLSKRNISMKTVRDLFKMTTKIAGIDVYTSSYDNINVLNVRNLVYFEIRQIQARI